VAQSKKHLGDLQLAIMRVLWERGEASASVVHKALLAERGLAPTTIATMLRKMEDKGIVRHRQEGRQFVYASSIDESEVNRSMVGELVERLFAGDPKALVSHLLEEGELDIEEIEALSARIEEAKKEARDDR